MDSILIFRIAIFSADVVTSPAKSPPYMTDCTIYILPIFPSRSAKISRNKETIGLINDKVLFLFWTPFGLYAGHLESS